MTNKEILNDIENSVRRMNISFTYSNKMSYKKRLVKNPEKNKEKIDEIDRDLNDLKKQKLGKTKKDVVSYTYEYEGKKLNLLLLTSIRSQFLSSGVDDVVYIPVMIFEGKDCDLNFMLLGHVEKWMVRNGIIKDPFKAIKTAYDFLDLKI